MKQVILQDLTNAQILENVTKLVTFDRRCTAKLIAHLAEIERRSLHLKLGFRSMFEYCQRELHLEESQIWLRLQVAKKCNEIPALLQALAEGTLSLTVAGRLAPHLTQENQQDLITDCRGMTRTEVEEYLVRFRIKPEVKGGVRKAPQRVVELFPNRDDNEQKVEPKPVVTPTGKKSKIQPATPERYNLSVSIGKKTREKLDRLATVLGKKIAGQDLEAILDLAIEAALDKKDPMRKAERIERRKQSRTKSAEPQVAAEQRTVKEPKSDNRYITASNARAVFKLAGYRCQFISKDGRRCTQRSHLQSLGEGRT